MTDPDAPATIADLIPRKLRRVVYSLLAALSGLQLIWHIIPERYDGRIASTVGLLGFGMAATYSGPRPAAPTNDGQEG